MNRITHTLFILVSLISYSFTQEITSWELGASDQFDVDAEGFQYFSVDVRDVDTESSIFIKVRSTADFKVYNFYVDIDSRDGFTQYPDEDNNYRQAQDELIGAEELTLTVKNIVSPPTDTVYISVYSNLNANYFMTVSLNDGGEKGNDVGIILAAVFIPLGVIILIVSAVLLYKRGRKDLKEKAPESHQQFSNQNATANNNRANDAENARRASEQAADQEEIEIRVRNVLNQPDPKPDQNRALSYVKDLKLFEGVVALNTVKINVEQNGKDDRLCIICMSKNKEAEFRPCEHICCCNKCALDIYKIDKQCPICREYIKKILIS